MTLTGLTMERLLTLLGVFGGAIVLLYILKLRRRRIRVPFSPLWNQAVPERKASSLFRALKRIISLLIQLAVLSLLVLAIADPRLTGLTSCQEAGASKEEAKKDPTTTVLVVDASASMRAVDVPGGRLAAAVDAGRKVIDELRSEDRAMVVELDARARPLTPFTADHDALLAAVAGIRAVDTGTDLRSALPFLRDLLEGKPSPRIVLVTDGGFESPAESELEGLPLEVVRVGTDGGDNIALSTFHVRPYLDDSLTYEIFYRVRSYVHRPVKATLLLYADATARSVEEMFRDENVVGSYPVELAPDAMTEDFIPNVEFPGSRFGARVVPDPDSGVHDVLPRDDLAFGLVPERRKLKVQLVTEDNLFLEAALFLRENLSFEKVKPADYKGPDAYDVTILDRFTPRLTEPGSYLLVDPTGPDSPFPIKGEAEAPEARRSKRSHPLMWKVSLVDLNLRSMHVLEPSEGDQVVAETSTGLPLIIARNRGGQKIVAWAFDIRQSDLPMRYAFPVMVVNTIHWFFAEDDALLTGRTTGKDWAIAVPWKGDRVTVRPPVGEPFRAAVVDGRALVTGDVAGVYELSPDDDSTEQVVAAANLNDERESSLVTPPLALPAWKPEPPPETPPKTAEQTLIEQMLALAQKDLWKLLLLAAVAILTLEWVTYNRRVTV